VEDAVAVTLVLLMVCLRRRVVVLGWHRSLGAER